MTSLLNVPHLPEKKVKTVLVSYDYPEFICGLNEKLQISTIKVKRNPDLVAPISTHADCMFVQLDKKTIFTESNNYQKIVNFLTSEIGETSQIINIINVKEQIRSPYPEDVPINIKVIGNKIICNINTIASEIKDCAFRSGMQMIHTNQGYAACSTIVINNNALITDDESIHISSKSNGIDTLLISKGSVKLKGYDYGFIGGTCGMIDKNLLAFTGKLNSHNDSDKIISFLNKYNISFIELTNGPLIDIGGIIPILE